MSRQRGSEARFLLEKAAALALPTCLQEVADLLGQVEKAVLPLVQGAGDGDGEPLLHRLGVALVEEIGGRAALGMDGVLEGLGQEDGSGADGAIWEGRREKQPVPLASHSVTNFPLTKTNWVGGRSPDRTEDSLFP